MDQVFSVFWVCIKGVGSMKMFSIRIEIVVRSLTVILTACNCKILSIWNCMDLPKMSDKCPYLFWNGFLALGTNVHGSTTDLQCLELCNKLNNFCSLCTWDDYAVNMLKVCIDWGKWVRIWEIANPEQFEQLVQGAGQTFILKWDGDFVVLSHYDVLGCCTGVSQTHKLGLDGSHLCIRRFHKAADACSSLGKQACTMAIYQYLFHNL